VSSKSFETNGIRLHIILFEVQIKLCFCKFIRDIIKKNCLNIRSFWAKDTSYLGGHGLKSHIWTISLSAAKCTAVAWIFINDTLHLQHVSVSHTVDHKQGDKKQ